MSNREVLKKTIEKMNISASRIDKAIEHFYDEVFGICEYHAETKEDAEMFVRFIETSHQHLLPRFTIVGMMESFIEMKEEDGEW
jgi:hypothetical protein